MSSGSDCASDAAREGLTLVRAANATGFRGVYHDRQRSKPFQAQLSRRGHLESLGYHATAEEAEPLQALVRIAQLEARLGLPDGPSMPVPRLIRLEGFLGETQGTIFDRLAALEAVANANF